MKNIITGIIIIGATSIANADCTSSLSFGQFKQDCTNSESANSERTVEYTEIPYNANDKVSKHKTKQENVASLEQSINQAYDTQSHFEPTHTQLDQVKQLLDYANSQGCTWAGKFDEPSLVCPE